MKKRIAIVTWYNSKNFGSQLQSYALYSTIKSLGFDVNMIYFHKHPCIRKLYYNILNILPRKLVHLFNKNVDTPRYLFIKDFLTEHFVNYSKPLNEYNAVVCGSDQIWAPNVFNPIYMLSSVPDKITKFSYAASVGLNDIPETLTSEYSRLLSRLSAVSVRENNGKELLQKKCGIESTVVLDPTLLLSANDWAKIEKIPTIEEPYIFCYLLNTSHNYKNLILDYQKKTRYKVVGITENVNDEEWMDVLEYKSVGPREFLGLIHYAKAVFTDSYHCTIFSMHFNRPFVTFERFKNTDKICQNSRIQQLDQYFNISRNIVIPNKCEALKPYPVSHMEFEGKRKYLKVNSISYLKKALSKC